MAVLIKNSQKQLSIRLPYLRKLIEDIMLHAGIVAGRELNVLLVDNRGIQTLNKNYFDRDRPTNVISFSYLENGMNWENLGDIVVSVEKAVEEGMKAGISPYERLMTLIVHGILHVIGFDHEKDPLEARRMRYREQKLTTFAKNHPCFAKLTEERHRA